MIYRRTPWWVRGMLGYPQLISMVILGSMLVMFLSFDSTPATAEARSRRRVSSLHHAAPQPLVSESIDSADSEAKPTGKSDSSKPSSGQTTSVPAASSSSSSSSSSPSSSSAQPPPKAKNPPSKQPPSSSSASASQPTSSNANTEYPDVNYQYPSAGERIRSHWSVIEHKDVKERYGYKHGYRVINQRLLPAINEYPSYEAVEERYSVLPEKHEIRIVYKDCCSFLGNVPRSWTPVKCAVPCMWSSDESQLSTADGVFFHIPSHGSFPASKPKGQYWIAGSLECDKYYTRLEDPEFMSNFEIEATYRISSEVPMSYGSNGEYLFMAPPKPKTADAPVVYVASNCGSHNHRDDYVSQLMQHIKVDSYGRCVHNKEFPADLAGHPQAKWELIKRYKFYLAFENANTPDWFTEKFFQPLDAGTVPVVMGAPNIDDVAPSPKSIIKVEDFASPKELADYLNYLDQNPAAYEEYLAWKKEGPQQSFLDIIAMNNVHSQCRMCLKIHDKKYGEPSPKKR